MKRHPFSMVEILLALGVIAIGICSVMVLFPVGANATRDAAMETYAANAADQILHMVKYKLTLADEDNTNANSFYNQWYTYICDAPTSSTVYPAGPNGRGIYSETVPNSAAITDDDIDDTAKWTESNPLIGGTTLQRSGIYPMLGNGHFYQIIVHRGNSDETFANVLNNNVIDFRGLATLWATKVDVPGSGNLPLNFATRLNLKIEWPVELPASARQSALYTLEIFNNK